MQVDFTWQRKTLPILVLLPSTQKWLDALPPRVQPRALCKFYPRVANLVAAMWADTGALGAYLDELLVDLRQGRKGFPRDVRSDLCVLRDHRAACSPNAIGK